MSKLMLVENDSDLISLLRFCLARHRITVENTGAIHQALSDLFTTNYDLLIAGWNLSDGCGIELVKHVRTSGSHIPILTLTEGDSANERLDGFAAGSDDCLSRPFHVTELICRVRALLRRPPGRIADVIIEGDLAFDTVKRKVHLAGRELTLRPKEFALLEFFMSNPNRFFSAEALLMRVWEADNESSPHTVVSTIHRLRKQISPPGAESQLRSNSSGYCFVSC